MPEIRIDTERLAMRVEGARMIVIVALVVQFGAVAIGGLRMLDYGVGEAFGGSASGLSGEFVRLVALLGVSNWAAEGYYELSNQSTAPPSVGDKVRAVVSTLTIAALTLSILVELLGFSSVQDALTRSFADPLTSGLLQWLILVATTIAVRVAQGRWV